jgi:hypothetical protein
MPAAIRRGKAGLAGAPSARLRRLAEEGHQVVGSDGDHCQHRARPGAHGDAERVTAGMIATMLARRHGLETASAAFRWYAVQRPEFS